MKKTVRMTKLAASPERVLQPGVEVRLPAKEAKQLIRAGAAVDADSDPAKRERPPESDDDESDDASWEAEADGHVCDVCGYESASAAGLSAHKRSHDSDDS